MPGLQHTLLHRSRILVLQLDWRKARQGRFLEVSLASEKTVLVSILPRFEDIKPWKSDTLLPGCRVWVSGQMIAWETMDWGVVCLFHTLLYWYDSLPPRKVVVIHRWSQHPIFTFHTCFHLLELVSWLSTWASTLDTYIQRYKFCSLIYGTIYPETPQTLRSQGVGDLLPSELNRGIQGTSVLGSETGTKRSDLERLMRK